MPTTGTHGIIIPDPSTSGAIINDVRDLAIQTENALNDVAAHVATGIGIENYATKTYVNAALGPYATKTYVDDTLSVYATKSYTDTRSQDAEQAAKEYADEIAAGLTLIGGQGIKVSRDQSGAYVISLSEISGGDSILTAVIRDDGTVVFSGPAVTDHGDGTFSIDDPRIVDNGDNTFTFVY